MNVEIWIVVGVSLMIWGALFGYLKGLDGRLVELERSSNRQDGSAQQ